MQTDEHFPDRLTVLVPHGLKRELDAAAREQHPDDERVRAQDFVARGDGARARRWSSTPRWKLPLRPWSLTRVTKILAPTHVWPRRSKQLEPDWA